jgi:hypothetical protein
MINKNLLEEALINKFSNKLLKGVVFEAFFRALPLNKEDLLYEIYDMQDYSDYVMEALDSETLLDRAIESCKDKNGLKMLNNLKSNIRESAIEATFRVMESIDTNEENSLKDVVDEADFTPQEINKFQSKGSNLSIKEIANIISDKVIKAIKGERNEYEENEQLKDKISSALADANGTDEFKGDKDTREDIEDIVHQDEKEYEDEEKEVEEDSEKVKSFEENQEDVDEYIEDGSLDSLMDIILNKTEARNYISFFSRVQDVCLEGILNTNEVYVEIPYNLIAKITTESTIDVFDKNKISVLDQLDTMSIVSESYHEDCSNEHFKEHMKTAMICAIVIYTMFETLKTMRLMNPHADKIRKFIDSPNNLRDAMHHDKIALEDRLNREISDVKKLALKATDSVGVSRYIDYFNEVRDKLDKLPDEYKDTKEELSMNIESVIDMLNKKIDTLNREPEMIEESSFEKRDREINVASFNSIARTYGKKPNVSEIRLVLDPANESNGIVDIELRNDGKLIDKTFVVLKQNQHSKPYMEYAVECASLSNLSNVKPTINTYNTKTCVLNTLFNK